MSSGGTGKTNSPAPGTAIEIGIVDGSNKLQGVSSTNPLPISGSITATNPSIGATGAAVPASGTYVAVNVAGNLTGMTGTANGLKVDVQASALPTGAATAAKQPALGTAGTASADVISVQGIASMTALKVDGSAVTQPVSGTITANAGSGTFTVSGTVTANAGSGTLAVSAASLPLPSGASTAAKQPALGTAGTASADVITVQGIASMTALKVDGSAVTQPVSGTITANAGTGTLNVDPATTNIGSNGAVGSVTGSALTGSYATVVTPGFAARIVQIFNSCNTTIKVSLDAGTTDFFILEAGESPTIDLGANGRKIAASTALQAKHNGAAPTAGTIRISAIG